MDDGDQQSSTHFSPQSFGKLSLKISTVLMTIASGLFIQMLQSYPDMVAGHADINLYNAALFFCLATSITSFASVFYSAILITHCQIISIHTYFRNISYLVIFSISPLVVTTYFFMLLLSSKFAWLAFIFLPIVAIIVWLICLRNQTTEALDDFPLRFSDKEERYLKLINFATTVACTGIIGTIIATVKSHDTHHPHIELLVLFLFAAALSAFSSMLLIFTSPPLSCFMFILTYAALFVLLFSVAAIAYDMMSLRIAVLALVPGFGLSFTCLVTEFRHRPTDGGQSSSNQDFKLVEMWTVLGGVDFTVLTVVYGVYLKTEMTPMVKSFAFLIVCAFACCLNHMLLGLWRPQPRSGQRMSWMAFYIFTASLHGLGMLNLLMVYPTIVKTM